jgi:hypothetical protein
MVTYTKDDDAIQVYDGSNFVGVGSDSGLIHIETQSVSAVASVSFNDVFSSTYDNYKILINWTQSGSTIATLRLRASGSDLTTATYDRTTLGLNATYNAFLNTGLTGWPLSYFNAAVLHSYSVDIFSPFLAEQKRFISLGYLGNAQTNSFGQNTTATSFTGFTVSVGAGNATGSISVYGYRKS